MHGRPSLIILPSAQSSCRVMGSRRCGCGGCIDCKARKGKRAARNARYNLSRRREVRRERRQSVRERRQIEKAAFLEIAGAERAARRQAARIARRQYAGKDAPLSKQVVCLEECQKACAWLTLHACAGIAQVLNSEQRRQIQSWSGGFKKRMTHLFTRLLLMCAFCGTCSWDGYGWKTAVPDGESTCKSKGCMHLLMCMCLRVLGCR